MRKLVSYIRKILKESDNHVNYFLFAATYILANMLVVLDNMLVV